MFSKLERPVNTDLAGKQWHFSGPAVFPLLPPFLPGHFPYSSFLPTWLALWFGTCGCRNACVYANTQMNIYTSNEWNVCGTYTGLIHRFDTLVQPYQLLSYFKTPISIGINESTSPDPSDTAQWWSQKQETGSGNGASPETPSGQHWWDSGTGSFQDGTSSRVKAPGPHVHTLRCMLSQLPAVT